ncbi:MAG: hypothetical protein H7145_09785 [Akkermansiaceae bacterium]|nr:hypothetical protein [Armatimonadota bacterium]
MFTTRFVKQAGRSGGIVALTFLLYTSHITASHARQLSVTPTVTTIGPLFRYDYSIVNAGTIDISLVSIAVQGLSLADIQNVSAPAGFSADFDDALGFVNFSESTQGFTAGSTLSGFAFESTFAPTTSSFEAFSVDADTGNVTTITGSTLAPGAATVPEAGSLFLGLTALLPVALGLIVRRRRMAYSVATLTITKGS